jgi:branched-chain amino acid transport system substrate-binding protein
MGIRYYIPVWRGDTWGDGLEKAQADAFNKLLQQAGVQGNVEQGIRYDPDATEFTTEAADLANKVQALVNQYGTDKVGVVFIGFKEVASFFTAASDHPILSQVKWVGSDGTAGLSVLVQDSKVAQFSVDTEFVNPIFAPGASPYKDQVTQYVKQKLGRMPDSYAYAAYDALWAIALGLLQVNAYDPVKVKAILPDIVSRMVGSTGAFQLDQYGDRASADYELWVVWPTDGGFDWKVAGIYHAATDSVEWQAWWQEAHA